MTTPNVLLLSLPWTSLNEPSLGLGILKSKLVSQNIGCKVQHLNIFLLKYLSAETYMAFADTFILTDFLFSYTLEKKVSDSQLKHLRQVVEKLKDHTFIKGRYTSSEELFNIIVKIRKEIIPLYLLDCLEVVKNSNATMVGMTCMFDQTIASVALSKLIKEQCPEKFIVLGGYALEGGVGEQIISSFPFIDCVNIGEGEKVIKDLSYASVGQAQLASIPGIIYRDTLTNKIVKTMEKKPISLDESPPPDYDDYLLNLEELEVRDKVTIEWTTIPIETSRGCWWGQVKHCVFCGIDDITMKYRKKSEPYTLANIESLSDKYSRSDFRISDYILPNNYYDTLLPQLSESDKKYSLSCEIKSNVKYDHFRKLKAAGFVEVQPGIESFSTPILKKMDKGVSGIQNVFTLILGQTFDIKVHYNILYGFPDDEEEDYENLIYTLPLLYHLDPPQNITPIAITRFAPLQTDPKRFGIESKIVHDPLYNLIFSEEYLRDNNFDLDNYCYYFDIPYTHSSKLKRLHRTLELQATHWKINYYSKKIILSYILVEGEIIFTDSRYTDTPEIKRYNSAYGVFYTYCANKINIISELYLNLQQKMEQPLIEEILDTLRKENLVMIEDHKLITLALPG